MSKLLDRSTLGSTRLGFADERDLDLFVDKLARFERGELPADDWKAFRLANGVYGQRQADEMMVRVKIPQGILSPPQLRALADAAERYGGGRGHLTTRQNLQLNFVKLADVEKVLRIAAGAGLTSREACGNSVRNVTTCPLAGASAADKGQLASLGNLSRWAFLLTFAGVGLKTDFREIKQQGARPFLVGALAELTITVVTLGMVLAAQRWFGL